MSTRKVNEFLTNTFNGIIKDTREYRAYELGVASGYFQLYEYVKTDLGKESANKSFEGIFNGTENTNMYFRELVKLSLEENSKADDIYDELTKCKNTHNI